MNKLTLDNRLRTLGISLSEEWLLPRKSMAITGEGVRLEQRVKRLQELTQGLLEKDGKPEVYDNFKFVSKSGLTIPPPWIEMISEIREGDGWRRGLERTYTTCFELTHYHGLNGGWLILLCDLVRPIGDARPLIIDLLPNVLESHPEIPNFVGIAELGNLQYLADTRDIFKEAAQYLKATFPLELGSTLPGERSLPAIKKWQSDEMIAVLKKRFANAQDPLGDSSATRNAAALVVATVVAVFGAYTAAEYFFDKAYDSAKAKIEAQQAAEKKAAEEREAEQKREWRESFGSDMRMIEGSSNHVDHFDRNRDTISRTA